jgi:hypothetical protein
MRYNVTGHPLLSQAVTDLGPDELTAHNEIAERLLGLLDIVEFQVNDQRRTDAITATAMQVNYQVEANIEAFILAEHTRGARRLVYRGGQTRKMGAIHPMARRIVAALTRTLTSATTAR